MINLILSLDTSLGVIISLYYHNHCSNDVNWSRFASDAHHSRERFRFCGVQKDSEEDNGYNVDPYRAHN